MTGWPVVALADVLRRADRFESRDDLSDYAFAGTYSFARGIFKGETKPGSAFRLPQIQRVREGDFVYCKIMAWEGAFGVVPREVDDCVLSGAFVVYEIDRSRLDPAYLGWYFKQRHVWQKIGGQSTGTNLRRRSLHPSTFEAFEMPLPPLKQQRQAVRKLDALDQRLGKYREAIGQRHQSIDALLNSAFRRFTNGCPERPLGEVAPIVRRSVDPRPGEAYPELGLRSFGRGTFHKPAVAAEDLGSKRLFMIRAGDLVFSNVFAWEGAVAVATDADDGRFGSHRFISCLADPRLSRPHFLCFHFLTKQGLEALRFASPGSAGRNRTLGVRKLESILVPTPPTTQQAQFETLLAQARAVLAHETALLVTTDATVRSAISHVLRESD